MHTYPSIINREETAFIVFLQEVITMPDPKKAPWEELRFNAVLLKSRIVFQILSILPNGTNDIESNPNFDELSSDEIMLQYELESEFEKLEGKYD